MFFRRPLALDRIFFRAIHGHGTCTVHRGNTNDGIIFHLKHDNSALSLGLQNADELIWTPPVHACFSHLVRFRHFSPLGKMANDSQLSPSSWVLLSPFAHFQKSPPANFPPFVRSNRDWGIFLPAAMAAYLMMGGEGGPNLQGGKLCKEVRTFTILAFFYCKVGIHQGQGINLYPPSMYGREQPRYQRMDRITKLLLDTNHNRHLAPPTNTRHERF